MRVAARRIAPRLFAAHQEGTAEQHRNCNLYEGDGYYGPRPTLVFEY